MAYIISTTLMILGWSIMEGLESIYPLTGLQQSEHPSFVGQV